MTERALHSGELWARIDPESGGAITSVGDDRGNVLMPEFTAPGSDSFRVSGWQTMFPNAGDSGRYLSVHHPAHGTAFHGSWTLGPASSTTATLSFANEGTPLSIAREVAVDGASREVTVSDTISNGSDRAIDFQYGHHVVFAATESSIIHLPQSGLSQASLGDFTSDPRAGLRVADVLAGGPEALAALLVPGEAFLEDPVANRSIRMTWSADLMPALWVWVVRWGATCAVGLEPVTSAHFLGLAHAVLAGDAASILPHSDRCAWLRLRLATARDVRRLTTTPSGDSL